MVEFDISLSRNRFMNRTKEKKGDAEKFVFFMPNNTGDSLHG